MDIRDLQEQIGRLLLSEMKASTLLSGVPAFISEKLNLRNLGLLG